MSGIGSAISIGASLLSSKKSSSSSSSANALAEARVKADEEALAFEKEKYNDWQEAYGGLEDNLSAYYNSLTPEYFATQGLEAFEQEQAVARTSLTENLAKRGIEDSGIAAAAEISMANTSAVERATIRTEAPITAAREQLTFLQVGLGQNPGASYSQALSNRASSAATAAETAQARADTASQAEGESWGSTISTVGSALSDYFNNK